MKNLLILTVGTGTAGRYSNLAEGLRHTVELLAPRRFWLVPSTSEDSLAIAELVGEDNSAFAGKIPLEHPDDLEVSRQHLRKVIAEVKPQLQKNERLVINPTSGTKQMTAAATLAALDEGIGDIVFTTGERVDGVVKTGTERIQAFDASCYFRERDLALAGEFFKEGDFFAAEKIFARYKNQGFSSEWSRAYTFYHWRRLDYEKAKAYRAELSFRSEENIVADILGWALFAHRHHDFEEAIRLSHKALEHAVRLEVEEDQGGLIKNIQQLQQKGTLFDAGLFRLIGIRNESTHGIRPATQEESAAFFDRVKKQIEKMSDIRPTPEINQCL